MTRRLLSITLAVLTVGLLGSCAKINDRIDSLEGRIDRIESDRIASIDQQIAAINSSISDLGTIRQNIQNLIDTTDGQEKDINSLKTADASLGQRIDELKAYTDETLKAYAKSDWVKATFATLEQHEWTCDTVAKIDARIGKLDKKLSESIKDSEESLRSWVNAQMESYYTAAQMDAKLAELLSKITTASGESEAKADSLAKELKEAKSAIATVKTELTEAYQSAIEKAIKTSEGKLSSRISSSVSSVNSKVSALAGRVDDLEGKVDNLTDRIEDLEGRIQSVTIIPAYSDGSVEADEDGELKLELIISPASAATGLTKENFKVLVTEVITKALTIQTPDVEDVEDNGEGSLTLTTNISGCTCAAGHSLSVAVKVVKDKSDLTTKFVPVTVTKKPIKTIADVLATVVGGFPNTPDQNDIPNNAWTNGNNVYAYIYSKNNQAALILRHIDDARIINSITTVTPGENCYTTSVANGDLTFKMTNGILTSFEYIATNVKHECDGTYDTEKTTLTMKKGDTEYDWNHITISIKGIDIVSGKYYFGKSTIENAAGDFIELTAEQIGSINSAEGLHIVKKDLEAETEYKTVLVVSNSAGYSKTIVATENTGEAPPPM